MNAQTDSHLWADTYDRNLPDIFGIESEIAKAISGSLQAKLTGARSKRQRLNRQTIRRLTMRICAAWLLKHGVAHSLHLSGSHRFLRAGGASGPQFCACLGAAFSCGRACLPYPGRHMRPGARQRNVLWRMRRNSNLTRQKRCSPWAIINIGCCVISGLPRPPLTC